MINMLALELNLVLLLVLIAFLLGVIVSFSIIFFRRENLPEAIAQLQNIIKVAALATADGVITEEELANLTHLILNWIKLVYRKKEDNQLNLPPPPPESNTGKDDTDKELVEK